MTKRDRKNRRETKNIKMLEIEPALRDLTESLQNVKTIYQLERALCKHLERLNNIWRRIREEYPYEVEQL